MLTAAEIQGELRDGRLLWNGEFRGDALLGTLGGPLLETVPTASQINPLDSESLRDLYGLQIERWDRHVLPPRQLVLAQLTESIVLSRDICGHLAALSHVARFGLQVHVSSPWIERGFGQAHGQGHVVLELVNHTPASLVLTRGMPVASIRLFRTLDDSSGGDRGFYGKAGTLASRYADEFGTGSARRDARA